MSSSEAPQRSRTELEAALEDVRAQLSESQALTHIGSWALDVATFTMTWSDELYRLLAIEPGSVVPTQELVMSRIHPADRAAYLEAMTESIRSGTPYRQESRVALPGGGVRHILALGRSFFNDEGEMVRASGTVQDITALKQAELLKDEFVSTINHELRTPLTSVLAALRVLAGGAVPLESDTGREMVEVANRNAARLERLVDALLDFRGLEQAAIRLEMELIPLGSLLEDSAKLDAPLGASRDVRIEVAPVDPTLAVPVDRARFQQVFSSIASNAIRFSPPGGVVRIGATPVGNGEVRISFADSGPGVAKHMRDHVFERFSIGDGSTTRTAPGTGLGLAIAKAIVELHDGRIGYDSVPGEGATFYIELPLAD